ncbi:MAG: FtsX-like permease family protein, partial [Thermoanaerobaculia bacterium]|nr:FtsX-like permease family protein [Thermoanaerobaculia bacterium]
ALERLDQTPGVVAASFVLPLPLNFASHGIGYEIEGRPPERDGERLQAAAHWVAPGYFATMRQPVVRGRTFAASDRPDAPAVAIVNRTFAERWWPGEEAVGRRVRLGGEASAWATIVGVVADSKTFFASEATRPVVFVPMSQQPRRSPFLVVRTEGDPHAAYPTVRDQMSALDPAIPLSEVRSMQEVVDGSMLPWRGTTQGLLLLAALALALALIGIYGIVASAAGSRLAEIGVRRAMGARGADVLRLVLGRSVALVAAGLAAGLAVGVALNQLLSGLLFGVEAHDPWTYAAVALLLLLAAALAALLPAWKAVRIDPIRALRYE